MYKIIYRTTRESNSIPFYSRSKPVQDLIIEEKRLGRLLIEYTGFSDDLLVKKHVAIWKDKADLAKFNEHQAVKEFVKSKEEYDLASNHINNIINEDINE